MEETLKGTGSKSSHLSS